MKKSRIASRVPHPESSLRQLPFIDLLVDTRPSCWNCGERLASHTDANAQLFDYLEVFYNQRRWWNRSSKWRKCLEKARAHEANLDRPPRGHNVAGPGL